MKNIISIILGILMFLKLMELLYGAIFLDKPLNPITKIIFILTLIYNKNITLPTTRHVKK
ncbi:hypothetical protein GZ155_08740 [Staphylococcus aureus]|nr:hypothetical protein [Staphylococcus aureus]